MGMSLGAEDVGLKGLVDRCFVARPDSDHSYPKVEVEKLSIACKGVGGDWHREAPNESWGGHGGALKAVCLWSKEVLEEFQSQGHPIVGGGFGENVLISGWPWEKVVPGVRVSIGEVLLEVTKFAKPCYKMSYCFVDGNYMVANNSRGPRSRVYAAVLREGEVSKGDQAVLHIDTLGAKPYLFAQDVVGPRAVKMHRQRTDLHDLG